MFAFPVRLAHTQNTVLRELQVEVSSVYSNSFPFESVKRTSPQSDLILPSDIRLVVEKLIIIIELSKSEDTEDSVFIYFLYPKLVFDHAVVFSNRPVLLLW